MQYRFGAYSFDPARYELRHAGQPVALRPQACELLAYLLRHRDRVVPKEELLAQVWPGQYVGDAVLHVCVLAVRTARHDTGRTPSLLHTVRGRGYRFVAPVEVRDLPLDEPPQTLHSVRAEAPDTAGALLPPPAVSAPSVASHRSHTASLVGREAELGQLHGWLARALEGERQMVFVTGEAGIGKTAVVDAFLAQVAAHSKAWMALGQCIEHYGAGEAYLPVLEALGRLGHRAEGAQLLQLLRRYAPTWLVQMPSLLDEAELEVLQRQAPGATQERMLREMAEAVEALTAERPLVLWLEDLHWSDYSTLELLAALARRREPARLLVLGTYRPADVLVSGHPLRALKQELQAHGQCTELPLPFLGVAEVTQYLTARFAVRARHAAPVQEVGRIIHQSTDGNPLFMVMMVDYLVAQGTIGEVAGQWQLRARLEDIVEGVPDSLRQLIEQQLERLAKEEQQVLEVASVAGAEFSAAAVAAGLGAQGERVEEWGEALVRRGQFLQAQGTERLPDGTITGRYSFLHALYQKVLYERLAVTRRLRLHRRIGEGREAVYGHRVGDIAAELAMHFERGQDYRRAVQYLEQAAQNALRRSANREAIDHLSRGLELLKTLPDTPERTRQELALQVALNVPLVMVKGYAAPDVEAAYARARALCQEVGETPQLFLVLHGLWRFYVLRADFQTAYEQSEQLLRLAQRTQDSGLLCIAHHALEATLLFRGEFALALAHLEQGVALYDPQQHGSLISLYGDDPKVIALCHGSWALWYLGYPDQALQSIHAALTLARELSHPFSLAFVLGCAAQLHVYRREGQAAQEWAEATIALANEQGFPHYLAHGFTLRGGALAGQGRGEEGLAQIRQGLATCQTIGQKLGRSYFLALLAEAYSATGQVKEGLDVLDEALDAAHTTGERLHEAELYRLKGEWSLQSRRVEGESETGPEHVQDKSQGKTSQDQSQVSQDKSKVDNPLSEAEECFWKAIEIARRQEAKSLELRAAMSLARLWQLQGKRAEAHALLAPIYGWFTEGFDTADSQEARALLVELQRSPRHRCL